MRSWRVKVKEVEATAAQQTLSAGDDQMNSSTVPVYERLSEEIIDLDH